MMAKQDRMVCLLLAVGRMRVSAHQWRAGVSESCSHILHACKVATRYNHMMWPSALFVDSGRASAVKT